MDAEHLNLNRPVHLARRDVYYEQAVDLLYEPETEREPDELVQRYDHILFLLKTSRLHARFCIRVNDTDERDREFLEFIQLLIGNVKAILTMINQQQAMRSENGFLGASPKVAIQLAECEQRAKETLRGVHQVLNLAGNPFTKLKKSNLKAMGKADRTRYTKARRHFLALVGIDEGVALDDTELFMFIEEQ